MLQTLLLKEGDSMPAGRNAVSEEDLQALADDELTAEAREVLLARIQSSPESMQRLEDIIYQKLLLKEWWKAHPVG